MVVEVIPQGLGTWVTKRFSRNWRSTSGELPWGLDRVEQGATRKVRSGGRALLKAGKQGAGVFS